MTKAVEIWKRVNAKAIPDGVWRGVWQDTTVDVKIEAVAYRFKTESSREDRKSICCLVTIDGDQITVEADG